MTNIKTPPLKDRDEYSLPLLNYFLKEFNKKYEKNTFLFGEAFSTCVSSGWSGNIRELKTVFTYGNPLICAKTHYIENFKTRLGEREKS